MCLFLFLTISYFEICKNAAQKGISPSDPAYG